MNKSKKVEDIIKEFKEININPKHEVLICIPSVGYKIVTKVMNHPVNKEGYVLLIVEDKIWEKK